MNLTISYGNKDILFVDDNLKEYEDIRSELEGLFGKDLKDSALDILLGECAITVQLDGEKFDLYNVQTLRDLYSAFEVLYEYEDSDALLIYEYHMLGRSNFVTITNRVAEDALDQFLGNFSNDKEAAIEYLMENQDFSWSQANFVIGLSSAQDVLDEAMLYSTPNDNYFYHYN